MDFLKTNPNTDNKVHLFVMVFAFASALKKVTLKLMHPDSRSCSQYKFNTPWQLTGFETTCTAIAAPLHFYNICYILTVPLSPNSLYRDTRKIQKTLYPDGKNHAIASLHRDRLPAKEMIFRPVLSSANTNDTLLPGR